VVAKLAAIGTAVTGAFTAITSSMSTGFAITAAGATSYAAAKNIPVQGYDKTKHISPVAPKQGSGVQRQEKTLLAKKEKLSKPLALSAASKPQSASRMASKSMVVRKRS
jgi:hypothetical protein